MALRMISLKVPAPAGDSLVVSQWMRKRPVSLGMSPTVALSRPCQAPTSRVTATMSRGLVGAGEQDDRHRAKVRATKPQGTALLYLALFSGAYRAWGA